MSLKYRLLTSGLIILFFTVIGGLSSVMARFAEPIIEAYNRSNLIRLHVIANSDSPQDQAIKLRVRDKIIQVTEPLLIRVEDPKQAERILSQHVQLLKQTARQELLRNGKDLPVTVKLGKFEFPQRVYPFGVLPAGEYKGLRVILGKGAGKNWWCVLYPPLCLLDKDAPSFRKSFTAQTQNIKIEYHLATLEKLLHKKGITMDRFWKSWGTYFGMI